MKEQDPAQVLRELYEQYKTEGGWRAVHAKLGVTGMSHAAIWKMARGDTSVNGEVTAALHRLGLLTNREPYRKQGVAMPAHLWEIASRIGNGNISQGIRIALLAYKKGDQ